MSLTTTFDVLIVYNSSSARSAKSSSLFNTTPFPTHHDLDTAYSYFLETCEKLGLTAALSSSSDIVGPGKLSSYWTYKDHAWVRHTGSCYSTQIFDKFSPSSPSGLKLRHLLFSKRNIRPYNHTKLFNLFFDKQKTYDTLPALAIPTLTLTAQTLSGVEASCAKLAKLVKAHHAPQDFGRSIIMKDRFGAGGNHIYKFKSSETRAIYQTVTDHPQLSFIIQPFTKFNLGYTHLGVKGASDIRLIFLNGRLVTSYIRTAKSGDFRCNQHQGGSIYYLKNSSIPKQVMHKASQITGTLSHQSTLFTLDFLMSNAGNPYLLEGNTGPGLTWDPQDRVDQLEAKRLIRLIAKDLSSRVNKIRPLPLHPHVLDLGICPLINHPQIFRG